MGAWIEILTPANASLSLNVAPLVGAWIEMRNNRLHGIAQSVAPLVGAWIEMFCEMLIKPLDGSLPLWERGLKYFKDIVF